MTGHNDRMPFLTEEQTAIYELLALPLTFVLDY